MKTKKENRNKEKRHFGGYTGLKLRGFLILAFVFVYCLSMILATWVDQHAKRNDFQRVAMQMENQIRAQIESDFRFLRENTDLSEEEKREKWSSSLYAALSSYAANHSTKYQLVSAAAYDENGNRSAQSANLLLADISYGPWVLQKSFLLDDYLTDEELETLAQHEAQSLNVPENSQTAGKIFIGISAENTLSSIQVQHTRAAEGTETELVWKNEQIPNKEQLTGGRLLFPGIQANDILTWQEWMEHAYLHTFPDVYTVSNDIQEQGYFTVHRETSFYVYPDAAYDSQSFYTIMIRSVQRPWLAAIHSMNYIHLWGAVLTILCIVLVTGIVERTFQQKAFLEKRQRDFTNAIAHEMKTPLSVIRGFTENLQENTSEEKKPYYLEQIVKQTEWMDDMVKEMVFLSRLEASEYQFQKERLSVKNLIEKILEKQNPRITEKQITATIHCEEDFVIDGEKRFLEQAFAVLIDNAVAYNCQEGSITIHIEKERCTIENTGSNIPEEDLPRVCELFFTGDKNRSRQENHLGTGLYLANRIFQLHGLKFKIRNTDNGVQVQIHQ